MSEVIIDDKGRESLGNARAKSFMIPIYTLMLNFNAPASSLL